MWAVLVESRQIPFELRLKLSLEVVALLEATCAEADLFLLAHPSDQFQLTFVFRAILAFTALLVPFPAEFLVYRPIFPLALDTFESACC